MYYITNYMTKDDVSPFQMVIKATLLKQSIEQAKAAQTPDAVDVTEIPPWYFVVAQRVYEGLIAVAPPQWCQVH
jgi:hypothetical protein